MLNLTLERIERQIRNLPVEHVYVVDSRQTVVLHRTENRRDRVELSDADLALMSGATLTHNHPGGRSFSVEDVEVARVARLAELRVVTGKRRFSIQPSALGWASVSDDAFTSIVSQEKALLVSWMDGEISRGLLTSSLAELAFHHRLWERVARRGLIRYSSERCSRSPGGKMYTLIEPPVNPFSPPENISAWVAELRGWRTLPQFQEAENRNRLERALAEAESWLERSRGRGSGARRQPPDRPAV